VQHPALNCWEGYGAEHIEGRNPWQKAVSLEQCKAECERHAACDGIVMFADFSPPTCWLLKELHLDECVEYPEFSVWERSV